MEDVDSMSSLRSWRRALALSFAETCVGTVIISIAAGLGVGRGIALGESDTQRVARKPAQVPTRAAPKAPPETIARARFVWRIEDLYSVLESHSATPRKPSDVAIPRRLSWTPRSDESLAKTAWIQHAPSPKFEHAREFEAKAPTEHVLDRIFVGANYWRISRDRAQWSQPKTFFAVGAFLAEHPAVEGTADLVEFPEPDGRKARLRLELSGDDRYRSWIVEAGPSVFWTHSPRFEAFVDAAPEVLVRARGATDERELSEWSPTVTIPVEGVEPIRLPALASNDPNSTERSSEKSVDIVIAPAGAVPASAPICAPPGTKATIGLRIAAGIGASYVRLQESLSDVSATYADMRGPGAALEVGLQLTDRWAVEAGYKTTPFELDNGSAQFAALRGSWDTYSIEAVRKSGSASAFIDRVFGEPCGSNSFETLLGIQMHQTPLALFQNSDNAPILRQLQIVNASLGGRWRRYLNPWTRTTVSMRGQKSISATSSNSGSSLSADSVMAFDGSLGADKRVTDALWVGLRWYGQYHKYNFTYSDTATTAVGQHSALISTVELRLSLEY